ALSCLFQLKSSTDEAVVEASSAICLQPGTGAYHVFFPESQRDALFVEIRDMNRVTQGRATIQISSLSDNPVCILSSSSCSFICLFYAIDFSSSVSILLELTLEAEQSDRVRWWPIYLEDHECVGKVQLSIGSMLTCDETHPIKSGSVVETLAFDLVLESAMRAQHFYARNLRLHGPWKWLLSEFADYYGVSDSYTKL
ncbi:Pesticidal crystal cry8ba protein, partial [Thalictrum thalictroides]